MAEPSIADVLMNNDLRLRRSDELFHSPQQTQEIKPLSLLDSPRTSFFDYINNPIKTEDPIKNLLAGVIGTDERMGLGDFIPGLSQTLAERRGDKLGWWLGNLDYIPGGGIPAEAISFAARRAKLLKRLEREKTIQQKSVNDPVETAGSVKEEIRLIKQLKKIDAEEAARKAKFRIEDDYMPLKEILSPSRPSTSRKKQKNRNYSKIEKNPSPPSKAALDDYLEGALDDYYTITNNKMLQNRKDYIKQNAPEPKGLYKVQPDPKYPIDLNLKLMNHNYHKGYTYKAPPEGALFRGDESGLLKRGKGFDITDTSDIVPSSGIYSLIDPTDPRFKMFAKGMPSKGGPGAGYVINPNFENILDIDNIPPDFLKKLENMDIFRNRPSRDLAGGITDLMKKKQTDFQLDTILRGGPGSINKTPSGLSQDMADIFTKEGYDALRFPPRAMKGESDTIISLNPKNLDIVDEIPYDQLDDFIRQLLSGQ